MREAEWACEGCIDMAFGYEEEWTSPLFRVLGFDSGGLDEKSRIKKLDLCTSWLMCVLLRCFGVWCTYSS